MDFKAWLNYKLNRTPSNNVQEKPVPFFDYTMRYKFYTLGEMQLATRNFNENWVIRTDEFGKLYKGIIPKTNEVVAIKQLNLSGYNGHHNYKCEVLLPPVSHHRNVVYLHGVCEEGHKPILVHEFTPLGSLDKALYGSTRQTILDWDTRLRIAFGVTKGLLFLHERGIIHRNLTSANIFLGDGYEPKLANFEVTQLNPIGNSLHLLMDPFGKIGYMAPECYTIGERTVKSDIYSLGVVFLELITGRKPNDRSRPEEEHNTVWWAKSKFKDCSLYQAMVDPELKGRFEEKQLLDAMKISERCVNDKPRRRPSAAEVHEFLSRIISCPADEFFDAVQDFQ